MALPETKNVIIYAVIFGIVLIAVVFALKVVSQPQQFCGNSSVEIPEQCDVSGCAAGEFCNSNCRCQNALLDRPIQESSCQALGGVVCGLGSSCSTAPLKINNQPCCLSSCASQSPELPEINPSSPVDSMDGRQEVIGIFKNSGISRSAASSVATLNCNLSTGETGVICEEQFCAGTFEDLCCSGSCNSFPYISYEQCYSFCLEEAELSAEGCEARCR